MRPSDYTALAALARDSYRTPELQAAWLLVKILRDAGLASPPLGAVVGEDNPTTAPVSHASRILERARAKQNGE